MPAAAETAAESLPSASTPEEEKTPERQNETAETPAPAAVETARPSRRPILRRPAKPLPQMRDEVTVKIEKIMEEGLNDAFQRLSPIAKQEFKLRGEETAGKIRELMQSTHVKIKKIFQLIYEWLKMLPGVNRFFLEQEAKIKTDKIIHLKEI